MIILRNTLKYLNIFAIFSTIFPYLMLLNGNFEGNIYLQYIFLVGLGFLAHFFQQKVVELTNKTSKRLFMLIFGSILFFATPFIVFDYNILHLIILALLSEFMFLLGRKLSILSIKQLMSKKLIILTWGSNLFIPTLCYNLGYDVDVTLIFIVTIILIFSRLFLLNIERIDTLSSDRGHEIDDIPAKLRQHNIIMVSIIFSTILAITLFLEKITNALHLFGLWAFERFKDFLRWLVSMINDELADYEVPVEDVVEQSPDIFEELLSEEEIVKNHEYLDTLLFIITAITIFWLIYKGLRVIIPIIIRFITNQLNANSNQTITIDDDDSWTVVETKIAKQNPQKQVDLTKRKWRKHYKLYLKSEQDFHKGYKLALSGVSLLEKSIKSSDTTLDISNKIIINKFKEITVIYNQETYGNTTIHQEYKIDILQVLSTINSKI